MRKWIAEFELEDGDTMPEHMDLEYKGAKIDFHCKPLEPPVIPKTRCSCEQIKWERDMAIAQLNELGYGLGEKPKTGHWILLDECSNSGYYCSECHKKVVKEGWSNTVKKIKFCPNCGCRMVEP